MMIPFNHKGSFVDSVSGRYSEWDQEKQLTILKEAYKMGVGIIAMKTCSGGKYSPSPGIEPSYKEAVRWVLEKDFISSAAIAFANFEQIDEQLVWLTGI
jgi:predicted aldo/keto reductase-like oxidoreductase